MSAGITEVARMCGNGVQYCPMSLISSLTTMTPLILLAISIVLVLAPMVLMKPLNRTIPLEVLTLIFSLRKEGSLRIASFILAVMTSSSMDLVACSCFGVDAPD